MKKTILTAATLLVCGVSMVEAQMRPAAAAPRTWISAYGQMYTSLAGFFDPGTESDWVFDDNALGLGLGLHRELAPGLMLGVDATFARPAYERRTTGNNPQVTGSGTASVGTAMATGRIASGGGADLGFYLTGGIGTIAYNLEDIGEWNADFALQAGTGLEYRMGRGRALNLEWGRIWGYHERDGIGGGAAQHGVLRLGLRFGR